MAAEKISVTGFDSEREERLKEERMIRKIKEENREHLQPAPAGWVNMRDLAKELGCHFQRLRYILAGEKIASLGENSWGNFLGENRHRAIYLSPQAEKVVREELARRLKEGKAKEDVRNFVDYLLNEQSKLA